VYGDALEFLEDERDGWRPYEALAELTDEQLERPVAGAHDWSARDLMAHLVAWQEVALAAAKELAVNETSATLAASDAEWATGGDAMNARLTNEWRAKPLAVLRERFAAVPGELRGYLTVVPEARWLKHATHLSAFQEETIDHYREHRADLEAILAAAR
jgi:Mycothiol maleylpyruvate isomerase N-terminal domain